MADTCPRERSPILLAGPTGVGKSLLAILLAKRTGGEVISVDSMQVYRGMDIGTAKPTPEERQQVPHHLIDILDLSESFDAAQFARRARAAVTDIQSRRRLPILCGGTGLYFKAFLEGLDEAPPADRGLRATLEATPLAELLEELQQRDPVAFGKIDRNNRRRVVRALEVIRLTGQPFSGQRASRPPADRNPDLETRFFCLFRSREDLRERISRRVDRMFGEGLVDETRRLLEQGLGRNQTALQALGYRQVAEFIEGRRSLAETMELVKVRTWQFARRQMTWFRHQAPANWIALAPGQAPDDIVARLVEPPAR